MSPFAVHTRFFRSNIGLRDYQYLTTMRIFRRAVAFCGRAFATLPRRYSYTHGATINILGLAANCATLHRILHTSSNTSSPSSRTINCRRRDHRLASAHVSAP